MASSRAGTVGIGWRQPHYVELLRSGAEVDFLEVHSENFFADGGAALRVLLAGRECFEVSLHGVGLALGSAAGLDEWHLERLARLVDRVQPVRVSDHAAFARAPLRPGGPVVHANDLLPVAFTQASLDRMVVHVSQVQDRLRRPLLVENLSAYLRFADDEMSEAEFFVELTRRAGCSMLLDVNNLFVNALNALPRDAHSSPHARLGAALASTRAALDALRHVRVEEIHVAGHRDLGDIVIDDHGDRVCPEVWQACEHALAGVGPGTPVLIEWDTDVPPLEVLLAEAARARELAGGLAQPEMAGAGAAR